MRVEGLPVFTDEDKLEAPSLCASEGASGCSYLVNMSEHIRARGGLFAFGLVFLSSVLLIFIIICHGRQHLTI